MTTEIQRIRAEFSGVISELRSQIEALESRLESRPPIRPKACLPDPEKFGGSAHKYDTWLPSIKAKLRVDGGAIGDSIAQFYYVYLNLESHVQAMVLPQLAHAEESESWQYQSILDQLSRVYDDPNKLQKAEDKLYRIRQSDTESLQSYIAKFERLIYEAKGQDIGHKQRIALFRNGLSHTIRTRLDGQLNLPLQYPEFVRTVQQLAGHSGAYSAPVSQPVRHSSHAPRQSQSHGGDPMELNAFGPAISSIEPVRARSISPNQRAKLRLNGQCVRCGSSDHWVQDCGMLPYSSGTGKMVTIAAINDDDDGSDSPNSASSYAAIDWKKRLIGGGNRES